MKSEARSQVNKQKVLITGAGSGIGRAVAKSLLAQGHSVVAVGRREALLRSLGEALPPSDSERLQVLPCDLSIPEQREGLVKKAAELAGGLTGMVYSAGLVRHQLPGRIDEHSLRSQLEINLVAPLRLGEDALEHISSGGAMVFLSSTLAQRPVATSMIYSAAKAGLEAGMKSLALLGASRQIRVNALSPGVVDTEMIRQSRQTGGEGGENEAEMQSFRSPAPDSKSSESASAPELASSDSQAKLIESLRELHPLGRLGSAEEVADAVLFLLFAPWMTGTTLIYDGGLLLRE